MPKVREWSSDDNDIDDTQTGDTTPLELRPYKWHGLQINGPKPGYVEATADCPFCTRSKLYINSDNSKADCKTCGWSGNSVEFLRRLHAVGVEERTVEDMTELCEHRGYLFTDTVEAWGLCKSLITKEWLSPAGLNGKGELKTLYRYTWAYGGKMGLQVTEGFKHEIAGMHLWDDRKSTVIICEGAWDALALWEVLGRVKWSDEEGGALMETSNLTASLLGDINVIAVPGANVWLDSLLPQLAGKRVILAFDSDHPKPIKGRGSDTGKFAEPVGMQGMKRAALSMLSATDPPSSIEWIRWGSEGYDPSLGDGTDLRDIFLSCGDTVKDRMEGIKYLWERISPIPKEWTAGQSYTTGKNGQIEVVPLACDKWSTLTNSYRKACNFLPGIEHALACMLATIASTESVGDQLWIRVIGVPGSYKTTLAEALSASRKYVRGVSTLKGFFSGFQTDRDGTEDNSLIARLNGKTLILKDADTLLKSPDRERILSEARDVYDRVARPDYRNKTSREYLHLSVTWILCGTPSIRELDSSDLGARFLDVIIMEMIDSETEEDILLRVGRKAVMSASMKCNGTPQSQDLPSSMEAKRLTAGYVNFLRENAQRLVEPISEGMDDRTLRSILHLSKFVSYMRARPSDKVETVERELSSRLMSQLSRLAVFLAVVMNRKSVDGVVMDKVRQVAIDTSRGKTLDIAKHLYESVDDPTTPDGINYKQVATMINRDEKETRDYMHFLSRIKAVQRTEVPIRDTRYTDKVYALSSELRRLYEVVVLGRG